MPAKYLTEQLEVLTEISDYYCKRINPMNQACYVYWNALMADPYKEGKKKKDKQGEEIGEKLKRTPLNSDT